MSQAMWFKEKFEIKKKCRHFEEKSYERLSWFLEDLVKFLVFFFWNYHIYLIGSSGLPTCNGSLDFLFVL
jgi:hypothetical protein